MLLLVEIGGVWADRLSRRIVMLSSDLVRCATQAVAALLFLTHHAQLWHLIALQIAYGAAEAFFTPAITGLIPAMVPHHQLQKANALIGLSKNIIAVFGPAVGGTVVAFGSPGLALALDAVSFAVSAAALWTLRAAPGTRNNDTTSFLAGFREGWVEVRTRTWLTVMISYFGLFNLAMWPAFFVLGPDVAKRSLGGASAWAIILTAYAIGSAVGGVLAFRISVRRPLRCAVLVFLLSALPLALLALQTPAVAIAVAALCGAAGLALGDALWYTTVQQHVPEHLLSRVIAIDWTGTLILNPVGFVTVGLLAAAIGARPTLAIAALMIAGGTIAVLTVPSVRGLTSGSTARNAERPSA